MSVLLGGEEGMTGNDGYCVVMCSCPSDEHAEKLARSIVEHKLAACVQISPIRSFYEWKGEIHNEEERLLFIKSSTQLYSELEAFISKNHPYEVPEIIQLPVHKGLKRYLDWIDSVSR
jgi:periplasmic divalent cation tolerance protein